MKECGDDGVEVPYQLLEPATLDILLREFVLREGTDYGERIFTLEEKVAVVRGHLQQKRVRILFDPTSESCNIVPML